MQTLMMLVAFMGAGPELGVRVGGGLVERDAVFVANPWFSAGGPDLKASFQAPLRFEVKTAEFREEDWDEPGDFGRIIRFLHFGKVFKLGTIAGLTLGHGTLVRRYHNGVDEDHHRTGTRFTWHSNLIEIDAFADRLMGPPVLGGRIGLLAAGPFRLGATLAADMAAPKPFILDVGPVEWDVPDEPGSISGTLNPDMAFQSMGMGTDQDAVDAPLLPRLSQTRVLPAFGMDIELRAIDRKDIRTRIYADVNTVDAGWGTHFGLKGGFGVRGGFELDGHAEIMVFGPRYMWAPFDAGYLIDRWQPLVRHVEQLTNGSGARMGFTLRNDGMIMGVNFADGTGGRRTDFTGFLRLVFTDYGVEGYWRHRSGRSRVKTLAPTNAMAALAGHMKVSDQIWVTMSASRTWREVEEHLYEPFSELLVAVEMAATP